MPATRQTMVNPLGLVTTPNRYGQYPEGASSVCDNFVARNAGELWQMPDFTVITALGVANDVTRKIMPLDAGHVYAWNNNSGNWSITELGNAVTIPTSFLVANLFKDARICPVRSRERMLVNSNRGVLVGDSMAPTSPSTRALRAAGMPQPKLSFTTTGTSTIPANIMVGYAAILTREFSDGYIVKSVPSPIYKCLQTSATTLTVRVAWSLISGVAAGDFIEVYRTDGLSTTDVNADPGTSLKLIYRQAIDSTAVSNGFIDFADNRTIYAPFYQTTGRELYTNPGQEGSLASNRQPDVNGAQAVFKGFTFFGNITERPQWSLSVPAGFGNVLGLDTAYLKANGVGARFGSATVTLGNNTVSGVSAADMVGIKVGQVWANGTTGFSNTAVINSVGATSFVMSQNANANATSFRVDDVIQLDGNTLTGAAIRIDSIQDLMANWGRPTFSGSGQGTDYEITANQSVPVFLGVSSVLPSGFTLVVEQIRPGILTANTLTVRATNGANYSPPIPELTATAQTFSPTTTPNLLRWSKDSEPEHAPSANEDFVGSSTLISFVSTKDALWIFCTDGIFRLSGDAGVWRVDVVDPGCFLCAPQCAVDMRETVYAYTNYGLCAVTDAGVQPFSDRVVKDLLPGSPFAETPDMIVGKNDNDQEILTSLSTTLNRPVIYNAQQGIFTRMDPTGSPFMSAITAFTYQDHPASGAARVLFASSPLAGAAPRLTSWDNAASFLAATQTYQPYYAGDPMLIKQWVDITHIFDSSNAGAVVTTTIGGDSTGAGPLKTSFNDAYATFGVIRKYAIAPTIAPSFTLAASATQGKYRGMSMRYVPVSIQAWRRQ